MDAELCQALTIVSERGGRLRSGWRLDWPGQVEQAILRLRLTPEGDRMPPLVAIVGGASSGKSTVFNNLLDGHLASRVTARGHMTIGPILAVHEDHRLLAERLSADGSLLPGFRPVGVELDGNTVGERDAVAVAYHSVTALRDVFLFDMPDFTSEAARQEGDISLMLQPWFDFLVVVVDHERWFDRQSISKLRAESARFGQHRWILFNRTREEVLDDADRAALRRQADRLDANGMTVLEFRRGRGFCRFPPGCLDQLQTFLLAPKPDRTNHLLREIATAAGHLLEQNEERATRLVDLRVSVKAAVQRTTPPTVDCMTSLMTPDERKHLEVVSRVLRIQQSREWLSSQTRRLRSALGRVPIVGAMARARYDDGGEALADSADRGAIAASCFEGVARRQAHEVQRAVLSSAFWSGIRPSTDVEPGRRGFAWSPALQASVNAAANEFDRALEAWTDKVEAECRGINPSIKGAIGVGAVALAVVLIAVPGPVAALTFASATGAVGVAFAKLAAATGAGALFGRHMGRLMAVIRERLLGSPEYDAVRAAADGFRERLESVGRAMADQAIAEAAALVIPRDDVVASALEKLREPPEESR